MKKILFIALVIISVRGYGQLHQNFDNQNFWINQTLTYGFLPKYSLHSEIQWRREEWIQHPQQLLLRFGINRDFGNGLSASAGYCYVYTSKYGDIPVKAAFAENRSWQQIQQKNNRGRLEMTERIRIEQRWVQNPIQNSTSSDWEAGPSVYSNRARILQRFNLALNKKSFENGTVYLAAYDEFFSSFGKHVPTNIFDQNRAFIGLGFQLASVGRIEVGYLNQLINKGYTTTDVNGETKVLNKREQNNIFSVSVLTSISYKEKQKANDTK
jgi:Protein of unknown function (DUF2490)